MPKDKSWKRKQPMKRASEPMRRDTPGALAWSKKERKPLAQMSKKAKARRVDWAVHLAKWMHRGEPDPLCQVCGYPITAGQKTGPPHHKILRSKGGDDDPTNLLGAHKYCHSWLHDHLMSAQTPAAKDRLATAQASPANLSNTLVIEWSPQQLHDLHRYLSALY